MGTSNPYSTVQRLYESHEKKQIKKAMLDEQLFNQKYSFHPTVYSQRPDNEQLFLTTIASEKIH